LCFENHAIVRDSESDFRSTYERIRRLHKAPGYIQIFCVRSNVSLRAERNYLNSGNERKTLLAMAFERDGTYLAISKILFQETCSVVQNDAWPVQSVNILICPLGGFSGANLHVGREYRRIVFA
jgi:hypothetical protein